MIWAPLQLGPRGELHIIVSMVRYTGMCRPNWCILHKKYINMGPIMTSPPKKKTNKQTNMRQIMVVNSDFGCWCITFQKRVDYGHSMLCVGNLCENIVCNNVFNVTILRI